MYEIRLKLHLLKEVKSYKTLITGDYTGESSKANEEITYTGFSDQGRFYKITRRQPEGVGFRNFDYYFDEDNLLFVKEYSEQHPTGFFGDYYFKDNRLIDYITAGYNRFENNKLDPGEVIMSEAQESRERLLSAQSNFKIDTLPFNFTDKNEALFRIYQFERVKNNAFAAELYNSHSSSEQPALQIKVNDRKMMLPVLERRPNEIYFDSEDYGVSVQPHKQTRMVLDKDQSIEECTVTIRHKRKNEKWVIEGYRNVREE